MKEDKSKKTVKQQAKVVDDKALDKVQGGMPGSIYNVTFGKPGIAPEAHLQHIRGLDMAGKE